MSWNILSVADSVHACTMREGHFRVALWLMECKGEVTAARVKARFPDIDRATAYRIVADWRNARGVAA